MFYKILIGALAGFFLFQNATVLAKETADQKFEALANKFIGELLEMNPEWATILGEHRYDNRLRDYSLAGVKKSREFNEKYLKELKQIPLEKLSKDNNVDARIMRDNLEYNIFQIDVLREHEWNPLAYNVGGAIDSLASRDFAPLKERLTNMKNRLEAIPAVIAAAKTNLKNPPKIYTETAIQQNAGVIGLIRDDISQFVDQAPEMKTALAPAREKAIAALEEYGKWLKEDLLPRSNGDFRIGDAKFRQKLRFALESDLPKEEILKRAEADLKATQEEMFEVAQPLYKKFGLVTQDLRDVKSARKQVIKAVLNKLAEKRPNNDTIVAQAEKDLQETTDFVRKNNLVTVPNEPVKVIVMPEYARGTSVAY